MNNVHEKQRFQVFCSYSHEDKIFQESLAKHLAALRRTGLIELWYDREIPPGGRWTKKISENLEKADIVLLLVSANFIFSEYCYTVEMKRALELHESQQVTAIPIIIKPCDWTITPIGDLQALPTGARPVSSWEQVDEAWTDVSRGIRRTIEKIEQERLTFKTVSRGGAVVTRSAETRSFHPLDDDDYDDYKADYMDLLLRFLRTWSKWSFSAARIQGWGARQPGYQELSRMDATFLEAALKELENRGKVESFPGNKSGSPLYHLPA